ADDPGCTVAFAAGSAAQVAADLAALHGSPVLTVTDGATDPAATGIINFVVVDGRVRFEIDARAAAANRLTISSKLLSLATRVTGAGQCAPEWTSRAPCRACGASYRRSPW